MGRKKIEKVGTFDKIGEKVELAKCPCCQEHTDCFAWMDGHCTALKESGGEACPFYKPVAQAMDENRRGYERLKEQGRDDLIEQYGKQLFALGVLNSELTDVEADAEELNAFADADYQTVLDEGDAE